MNISGFEIHDDSACFIIAEVGNNHNGCMKRAYRLIDEAKTAGADCVKFQMRNLDTLYNIEDINNEYVANLEVEYVLELLKKNNLSSSQLTELFDYCKKIDIVPLCTPWDIDSLNSLLDYGMTAFKVSSADLNNTPLITAIAKSQFPMICSTGMSTEVEIIELISTLEELNANYILLHSNSTYPTPASDINLNYIGRLQELSKNPVGYSGHEIGYDVVIAAVALGARVIEKHITLDKTLEGSDHRASLLPEEFSNMVKSIRKISSAMGTRQPRVISQGEQINRNALSKSVVAKREIKKGEVLSLEMLTVRSPGTGISPNKIDSLVGKKVDRDLNSLEIIYSSYLDSKSKSIDNIFSFKRPWGIPVRFHDFKNMMTIGDVSLVEFHLSFKDLSLKLSDYFDKKYLIDFIVHAPEIFKDDHLLDLASIDENYRERSIQSLQAVINLTLELKCYFPKATIPKIIVNVGGFSKEKFLSSEEKELRYEILKQSLLELNSNGVELLIQSMPPFPWHAGGSAFHNLFTLPNEIITFCKSTNISICLDIAHAQMSCNYFNMSLTTYLSEVSQYIGHLHISDADGVNGEGVAIGQGQVDFNSLLPQLESIVPHTISFIPEPWNGHLDDGKGFREYLNYLTGKL